MGRFYGFAYCFWNVSGCPAASSVSAFGRASFPGGEAFVPGFGAVWGDCGVFCAKKGHPLVVGGCPGDYIKVSVLPDHPEPARDDYALLQNSYMLLYNRCVYLRLLC